MGSAAYGRAPVRRCTGSCRRLYSKSRAGSNAPSPSPPTVSPPPLPPCRSRGPVGARARPPHLPPPAALAAPPPVPALSPRPRAQFLERRAEGRCRRHLRAWRGAAAAAAAAQHEALRLSFRAMRCAPRGAARLLDPGPRARAVTPAGHRSTDHDDENLPSRLFIAEPACTTALTHVRGAGARGCCHTGHANLE